jgi:putative addiction module killer protein
MQKSLGRGLWETRIHYGPGYRLYYVRRGQSVIVLLCGGDKSSQGRDIKTAREVARYFDE